MNLGGLALRTTVGGLFIGHGLQKLTGAFGGPGLEGTEKMVASLGLAPVKKNARAIAFTETLGGIAILTGTATPVAAGGLIAAMITAVRTVHWRNGVWNSKGGYEFNAALIAALLAIADAGPGVPSMDALIGKRRWGPGGAIFALALGIGGSVAVLRFSQRRGAEQRTAVSDVGADAVTEAVTDTVSDPGTDSVRDEGADA